MRNSMDKTDLRIWGSGVPEAFLLNKLTWLQNKYRISSPSTATLSPDSRWTFPDINPSLFFVGSTIYLNEQRET